MADNQSSLLTKQDLQRALEALRHELKAHMSLIAETILSEFRSIHRDKIQIIDDKTNNHEKRITVLETRVGV